MNRTEFLAALALRLEDLPEEEREEAVKYYSEYLDEVGPDGEGFAIEELGGPEKVGNIIRANCGMGPFRPAPKAAAVPELTLDGPGYSQAVENTAQSAAAAAQAAKQAVAQNAAAASTASGPVPPTYTVKRDASSAAAPQNDAAHTYTATAATSAAAGTFSGAAPDGRSVYTEAVRAGERVQGTTQNSVTPPTYSAAPPQQFDKRNTRLLWIIIIIVLFPMWIGLFGGLIGLVFGVLGAFIGFVFAGFGTFITGLVHAALAIPLFFTSPATALATIGLSLLAAGLGAFLGSGTLYLGGKVIPCLWRGVRGLFSWLRGKVSGYNG